MITKARPILVPVQSFRLIPIKANVSIMEAGIRQHNFVLSVIALEVTKLSSFFLYIAVLLNHLSSRSEPFAKQNAESSRNGVVGRMGRGIPVIPNPSEIKPPVIHLFHFHQFLLNP